MEFSKGTRVIYAGGDASTGTAPGEHGTVAEMSKRDREMFKDCIEVNFDVIGPQIVLIDCLALA